MKRAARIDSNQAEIVAALRRAGCSVQTLASLGRGVPDLLVGRSGRSYLLEIKDGSKCPSARQLTPDQQAWHEDWQGQVEVVETIDQALQLASEGKDKE